VLVQSATVARWHREGFRGCWRRRSRRPGRPRIDLQLRSLIGRMATENGLWGAPRIHGELLKLGFTVSERTVSRYLPDRPTRRSQTWRTFLANHIGHLAFASTASSFGTNDDDVDASVLSCRRVPRSRDGRYPSDRWAFVDGPASLQPTSLIWRVAPNQLRRRRTRLTSGKDPPQSWAVECALAAYRWRFPKSRTSISANERMSGRRPSDSESLGRHRQLWLALRPTGPSTSLSSDIAFARQR
jgi:hypothetical protein